MEKTKTIFFDQRTTKPLFVEYAGRIKKIAMSAQIVEGRINGDKILIAPIQGQHIFEFDPEEKTEIELVVSVNNVGDQIPGYIVIYEVVEIKETKRSSYLDDLERLELKRG